MTEKPTESESGSGTESDPEFESDSGIEAGPVPADGAAEEPAASIPDGPRKLHPLTVPYQFVQRLGSLLIVVILFGGSGIVSTVTAGDPLIAAGAFLVVGGAFVLTVGYFVAHYRRFEYELTPDTFDIRSGVLSRREREIPLRRIQNVDISQNVVQRALGVAEVGLETAGGGGTEAQLRYVGEAEADRLQSEISRLRHATVETGEGTPTGEAEPERFEPVFSITDHELAVLTVVSMDLRVVSFLFLGASVFAPSLVSTADPQLFFTPEGIAQAVFGPLAGVGTILALALVSGLLSAAKYYGFVLQRGEEELRYERGLLQRFRGTIPLAKVQTLTIRENVIARVWGYASLYIDTAGSTGANDGSTNSQSAIPIASRERVEELAQSLEPAALDSFRRPPKRARWRYTVRYAAALAVLAGLLYVGEQVVGMDLYWFVPLAGLSVVPLAAHLKWKHRGFAVDDHYVVTRNGFWTRETKVVPLHRVQTVFSSETVFQRRRNLGTVTIDTAGSYSFSSGDPQAVDIDRETVAELRERVTDGLNASLRRRADERERERRQQLAGTD